MTQKMIFGLLKYCYTLLQIRIDRVLGLGLGLGQDSVIFSGLGLGLAIPSPSLLHRVLNRVQNFEKGI